MRFDGNASKEQLIKLLRNEVNVIQSLNHGNMVNIYDSAEAAVWTKTNGTQINVAFMVLELV